MATAHDMIVRAMKLALVLGEGETPSAEQAVDALATLNDMLQGWNLNSLAVYQSVSETFNLVPLQSTYTIGAGANFNTSRPVRINSMYVTYQGVSYPVEAINQDEYDSLTLKSMRQTLPAMFLYRNTDPAGTLTLWPAPDQALPLTISADRVLTEITSLAATLAFPPGYAKAIRSNLALELSPEYGREPTSGLVKMARESLAEVKRANRTPVYAEYDPALIGSPSGLAAFLSGW